jgi:hypothetical protein
VSICKEREENSQQQFSGKDGILNRHSRVPIFPDRKVCAEVGEAYRSMGGIRNFSG